MGKGNAGKRQGKPQGKPKGKLAVKGKAKAGKGGGRGKKAGKTAGKKAGKGASKGAGKGAGKGAQALGSKQPKADAATKKRTLDGKAKDGGDEKTEAPRSKKVLKKERRKEVTSLYSELTNPGRKRKGEVVVAEILALLSERKTPLGEYCSKELGSRVVQACLKWGSKEQRRAILTTVKDHIVMLSTNRYGHMVVLKLLRYVAMTSSGRKPTQDEKRAQSQNLRDLLQPIHGKHLHSIFYHRQGCQVINGIYHSPVVDATEKRRLFHEVAVPRSVALLRPELPGSKPLRQLLKSEDLTAEQRLALVDHLQEATEKAVDKELLGVDIIHLLFQAYTEVAKEEALKELAEKCMAGAPYLLSSKAGAEACLRLLGVASAKHKKALCRDLKGKFVALAMNSVDYLVMMRLAGVVDDTVMLGKTMLAEWMPELEAICQDKYGHRVLAWILHPGDTKLFSPYELELLALPAPSALKATETRRQELVRILRPPLRAVLLADPLKHAGDLCAKEVLAAYVAGDWDGELIEGLLGACEKAIAEEDCGLLGSGTVTTTLLVLAKLEPAKADAAFAMPLWRRVLQPALAKAVVSRCAFILLGLLRQGGAVREAVLGELRNRRAELAAAVKKAEAKGKEVKGAKTLLEALDAKPGADGRAA